MSKPRIFVHSVNASGRPETCLGSIAGLSRLCDLDIYLISNDRVVLNNKLKNVGLGIGKNGRAWEDSKRALEAISKKKSVVSEIEGSDYIFAGVMLCDQAEDEEVIHKKKTDNTRVSSYVVRSCSLSF